MNQLPKTKTAILDRDGRIKSWLDAGRGIRVWQSQDLSCARPDYFTPGGVTEAPHWAYRGESYLLSADECAFYSRMPGVKALYSDSPAGFRAAERKAEQLGAREWTAPVGKFASLHTVERITLAAVEYLDNPDGKTRRAEIIRTDRSTAETVLFRVAVVEWIAKTGE